MLTRARTNTHPRTLLPLLRVLVNLVFSDSLIFIYFAQVNPLGGAIALGHPLGCTGARQIATLLHQMKRTKEKLGVVSMCIGTGMGAAALFENEMR